MTLVKKSISKRHTQHRLLHVEDYSLAHDRRLLSTLRHFIHPLDRKYGMDYNWSIAQYLRRAE